MILIDSVMCVEFSIFGRVGKCCRSVVVDFVVFVD